MKEFIRDRLLPEHWHALSRMKAWLVELTSGEANIEYPFVENVSIRGQDILFNVTNKTERLQIRGRQNEKYFIETIDRILTPGNVFYDIGAANGMYSLFAGSIGADVYAFEPDTEIYNALIENRKLNSLDHQISPYNLGLWDENTSLTLRTDGRKGNAPQIVSKGIIDSASIQNVKTIDCVRLDQFITEYNLPLPNIVKIDVEGAEEWVIRGFGNIVAPKHILLEIHPNYGASFDSIKSLLNSLGYNLVNTPQPRGGELHCYFLQS